MRSIAKQTNLTSQNSNCNQAIGCSRPLAFGINTKNKFNLFDWLTRRRPVRIKFIGEPQIIEPAPVHIKFIGEPKTVEPDPVDIKFIGESVDN